MELMTVTVNVTKKHIEDGLSHGGPNGCPIALALRDILLPNCLSGVSCFSFGISDKNNYGPMYANYFGYDYVSKLPDAAEFFSTMQVYYNNNSGIIRKDFFQPFSFEVEIPRQYLKAGVSIKNFIAGLWDKAKKNPVYESIYTPQISVETNNEHWTYISGQLGGCEVNWLESPMFTGREGRYL